MILAPPHNVKLSLLLIALCVASSGCSALKFRDSDPKIAEQRQERKSEALRAYEARRDAALINAATEHLQRGNDQLARDLLDQLIVRNPDHAEARHLRLGIYLTQGEDKLAEQEVEFLEEQMPDDSRTRHARALLADDDDQETAFATQPDVPSAGPDVPLEPVMPASFIKDSSSNAAAPRLRGPIASRPNDPDVPYNLALDSLRKGEPDVALAILEDAVAEHPEAARLYRLQGLVLLGQGASTRARATLNRAVSLDKGDALSYLLMGYALQRTGESQAARQHFAEARRLDPTLPLQ